ncbi:MAG: TfoX/Sxy family protein [Chthoniobacterales bacterium]
MAHNEKLTAFIRHALADAGALEEKKMFRGLTFMLNGKMCISVGPKEIMCRIDPALHDQAVQKGARTVVMKGRPYRGWIRVGPEKLRTEEEFAYWVGLARDFNRRAKASKKRKREMNQESFPKPKSTFDRRDSASLPND